MAYPTAPIAAGTLVGGYTVARYAKQRPLAGVALLLGTAANVAQWRRHGNLTTGVLTAAYLGGFGVSHPLAKRIGAWPSVLAVAAVSGAASHLLADRR